MSRLHREFLLSQPTIDVGMSHALRVLIAQRHGEVLLGAAPVDWSASLDRWVAWLDQLAAADPPPRETEVLWFETPDISNPPVTSVAGYRRLGPRVEGFGTDEHPAWPTVADEARQHLALPDLDEFLASVGWDDTTSEPGTEDHGRLVTAVMTVSHVYQLLVVLNGLPRTRLGNWMTGPHGVAALIGWKSGEADPVGQWSRGRWEPIRKAPPKPIVLSKMTLEQRGFLAKYQPKRFVAAGGDLEERNEYGNTLLMAAKHDEPRLIQALLAAGADPNASRHDTGESVLSLYGAADLRVLRDLFRHGADVHGKTRRGWPLWKRVVRDGRCTAAHLRFYEKRGVAEKPVTGRLSVSMGIMAGSNMDSDSGRRRLSTIKFLISRGHEINVRDRVGRSPLWIALEQHAVMLVRYPDLLAKMRGGTHDEMARLLLSLGADPNERYRGGAKRCIPAGATPLMVRRYDNDRLVRALLKHGADPHARCARGLTALDYARLAARQPEKLGHEGAAACVRLLERAMRRKPAKKKSSKAKRAGKRVRRSGG